ncbi:MbcA/ParS/Xre antitoxin family protein [Marinobacter goseongensis]|uniref:MbcA/ParS/Xre antitoxin family protein n=1 Tax=Marinobacter goseongensis TaxID=453838 RepID=UPI002004F051|nr:MbcA/ParS/Xre antitoxin family protein [Marinobacter goseongensis]MCK7553396.1 MbcA/ParS/Xre antitoxin family protein [Marinobacter goseongensis]
MKFKGILSMAQIGNVECKTREQIVRHAEAVFGDADKASRWLNKPKKQLNGMTPKDAIKDAHGAAAVVQMLRNIDNGCF